MDKNCTKTLFARTVVSPPNAMIRFASSEKLVFARNKFLSPHIQNKHFEARIMFKILYTSLDQQKQKKIEK